MCTTFGARLQRYLNRVLSFINNPEMNVSRRTREVVDTTVTRVLERLAGSNEAAISVETVERELRRLCSRFERLLGKQFATETVYTQGACTMCAHCARAERRRAALGACIDAMIGLRGGGHCDDVAFVGSRIDALLRN